MLAIQNEHVGLATGTDAHCDRRSIGDFGAMRMEMHPDSGSELVYPQPPGLSAALVHSLDDMITGRLDEAAVPQRETEDLFESVRLNSDDFGHAIRVVDLAPDLVLLDQLADWDHSLGRGDERLPWLTC